MKRKFLSVLIALVLVLSMSLVTAVPAAASPATLNVVPFELQSSGGTSTAAWSTSANHTGSWGVNIGTATDGTGYGRVAFAWNQPLSTITDMSYWYRLMAGNGSPNWDSGPYMNIEIDTDDDDVTDAWVLHKMFFLSPGLDQVWQQWKLSDDPIDSQYMEHNSTTMWHVWDGSAMTDYALWSDVLAVHGSDTVIKIKIAVGDWASDIETRHYVDDIQINGVTYCGKIQDAIDSASTDDIISVADGTYTENIVVDESLTIQAASTPIIDGDGALGPGVHITAEDVTFQGFTVTNFTCTPTSGIGAMLVEGDGAIIDGNEIYAITTTTADPAGIGIDVHASNVEVTNNIVHDVDSIGIRVRHDWDTAPTVSNNVLLENNEVYRTANTGVLVTGYAKGVTIRGNEIYESLQPTEYNLFVHYGAEDVLIENNIIRDPYNSIYGHNVVLAGCDNVTISGNTITGATSGKSIYLLSDYAPWVDTELLSTNVNIINNDIQNGKWGVRLANVGATDPSQMAATTTINFNNISGNTEYGVENTIATDVDAQCNWWGDVAGPKTQVEGNLSPYNPYDNWTEGDAVTDYVDYLPWLIRVDLVTDFDGWNIVSWPIWVVDDDEPPAEIEAIYYFDSSTQYWGVDPYQAGALDAYYVKVTAPITFSNPISSEATFPQQKEMKVGWNFVGLAELYEKAASAALNDALFGTGETDLWGYSKVISPSLNGVAWTYLRGGVVPDMFPTKGYWVFMVNDGVLGGFTSTPIIEVDVPIP